MTARVTSIAARLVVALAVAVAFILSPAAKSSSHDLARLTVGEPQHAGRDADNAAPGHVHENGTTEEQKPNQTHGHDLADHCHETPGVVQGAIPAGPVYACVRFDIRSNAAVPDTYFGLLRPPRALSSLSEEA